MYLSSSSTAGENGLTNLHLENSKDKVLLEAPMLITPTRQESAIYIHSDFLTIPRILIYKSQNDP